MSEKILKTINYLTAFAILANIALTICLIAFNMLEECKTVLLVTNIVTFVLFIGWLIKRAIGLHMYEKSAKEAIEQYFAQQRGEQVDGVKNMIVIEEENDD